MPATIVQTHSRPKGTQTQAQRRGRVVRQCRGLTKVIVGCWWNACSKAASACFTPYKLKFVSERIASYAIHEAGATVLVNFMRIPCFGRRMTIGRASMIWSGAN
jgi:hypothetical protein